MPFSNGSFSVGEAFGSIKERLGIGDHGRSYDGYDDYAQDYGEYGFDDDVDYGDEYAEGPEASYEPRHEVSTRSASSSRTRGAVSGESRARLVSIDDMRARTQIPESLNRNPLPPRHVTSPNRSGRGFSAGGRTAIDGTLPSAADAAAAADEVSARANHGHDRAEALDGLFAPTTAPADVTSPIHPTPAPSTATAASTGASYDPYDAYSGAGATRHSPTRSVSVLAPQGYGEAERVAKSCKAGDAVVLDLRTTPEPLVKRLLDFSFGVASALDASVDCVAGKVFVIVRGAGLTDAEKAELHSKGVI